MLINVGPGQMTGGDVRGFGAFGAKSDCPGADALLSRIDTLRDALFEAEVEVGDGQLADQAAKYLNAPMSLATTPGLLKSSTCEVYDRTLRDLINRMESALKGAGAKVPVAPLGLSFAGLPLPAKIGLGIGALALGAGAITLLLKG